MASTSTPMTTTKIGMKRKSFRPDSITEETPSKQSHLLEDLDDEDPDNERSKHRSLAVAVQRVELTKDEMLPQLDLCMKLAASNKIDSKNVWAFKIIDILNIIARDNIFDRDTLKIAANSLEAGTKVFSVRVDGVHAQTLQLASNMARNFQSDQNLEEEVNMPTDPDAPSEKKRRNKVKKNKMLYGEERFPSTTNHDRSKLCVPIKQLPSVEFQLNYKGYLNRYLQVDHELNYKFMTLVNYCATESDYATWDESVYDENIQVPTVDMSNMNICPAFRNLDGDSDDAVDIYNDAPDASSCPNDDIIYDNDGVPIAELDGSIHDPFQDPNFLLEEEVQEGVAAEIGRPNIEMISHAKTLPSIDEVGLEYLYLSLKSGLSSTHLLSHLWAGPSHWKLKYIKPAKSIYTGSVQHAEKKVRRGKKKEIVEVEVDPDAPFATALLKHIRKKNAKTMKPSPYRLPMQLVDDNLLPKESFRCRYITPAGAVIGPAAYGDAVPSAVVRADDVPDDVPDDEFNYDNANDSQFCINADDDDAGPAVADTVAPSQTLHQDDIDFNYMQLADAERPEIVPKCTIKYARIAKKMNMRRLKCALWDYLSGADTYLTGEIDSNTLMVMGEKHFKEVYKQLPKTITQAMQEALSAPLAFAALLHLANEKCLDLKGVPTLDDIIIKQKY